MSETMIERVARSIARTDLDRMVARDRSDGAYEWAKRKYGTLDAYVEAHWRDCAGAARFAIAAMREPTEAMGHAAAYVVACLECKDGSAGTEDMITAQAAWRKMIDAALSPPPESGG